MRRKPGTNETLDPDLDHLIEPLEAALDAAVPEWRKRLRKAAQAHSQDDYTRDLRRFRDDDELYGTNN